MLVRIEVEFDDTEMSIVQRDVLAYSNSEVSSGTALLAMGRCAGQMIAALAPGTRTPVEVMVAEFHEAVLRAAKAANN